MAKTLRDCRVTVIGLGLMGASLCMDLMQNKLCREVRGVARRSRIVLDAFFAGAVDLATNDLHTGVLGADIVILATPVRTIIDMLDEIGPLLWPGTVVMDMGSTKGRSSAPPWIDCRRGAAHRRPSHDRQGDGRLHGGRAGSLQEARHGFLRRWTGPALRPLTLATELVEAVGAWPVVLAPERHDRLVARLATCPTCWQARWSMPSQT